MLRDQDVVIKSVLVGVDEQFFMPDKVSVHRTMLELTVAAQRVNFGVFKFTVFVSSKDLVVPVNNVASLCGWQIPFGILCSEGPKDGEHENVMDQYRRQDIVCTPMFSTFQNLTYLYPVIPRSPFLDSLIYFSRDENLVDYDRKAFVAHSATIRK